MTTNKHYYLVDNISETVLGSFLAKNERMAFKMLQIFDFKKANLNPDDCSVYCDPVDVSIYETYDEVVNNKNLLNSTALLFQLTLDFEGEKDA